MKKLKYTGKNKIRLLVPFDKEIKHGEEITVTNEQADSLILAGFEEVKEKKEDKKEANK